MHVLERTNQRGNMLQHTMLHQCIFILGNSTGGSKASDLHPLEIAKYCAKSSVNYFGTCPKFKRFWRPRVVIPNFYDYNPPTFVIIASQFWIVNSQLLSIVHVSNPFKISFFSWFSMVLRQINALYFLGSKSCLKSTGSSAWCWPGAADGSSRGDCRCGDGEGHVASFHVSDLDDLPKWGGKATDKLLNCVIWEDHRGYLGECNGMYHQHWYIGASEKWGIYHPLYGHFNREHRGSNPWVTIGGCIFSDKPTWLNFQVNDLLDT